MPSNFLEPVDLIEFLPTDAYSNFGTTKEKYKRNKLRSVEKEK
jgi:hypothetical protein